MVWSGSRDRLPPLPLPPFPLQRCPLHVRRFNHVLEQLLHIGEGVDDGDINSGNPGDEGLEGRAKIDGEQQYLEMGNDGDEPGMGGGSRRSTTGKLNSQRLQVLN